MACQTDSNHFFITSFLFNTKSVYLYRNTIPLELIDADDDQDRVFLAVQWSDMNWEVNCYWWNRWCYVNKIPVGITVQISEPALKVSQSKDITYSVKVLYKWLSHSTQLLLSISLCQYHDWCYGENFWQPSTRHHFYDASHFSLL